MVGSRVYGDVGKLVESVVGDLEKNIERRVAEVLEAARSILSKSYTEALAVLEREFGEEARTLEERLRSSESSREVELRRELARLRAQLVEDVLDEVLSRVKSEVPREQYIGFIRRLLQEARERGGDVRIVPTEQDREIVQELAAELGLPVEEGSEKGYGGFVAVTSTGVRLDYRLESVLGDVIDRAKAVISEKLFGASS
ncbi:MAG: V-type ATP synthase subunit E [Thermoproteota archaeon]